MEAFASVPGVLRLGSTGPAVTLLHSYLIRTQAAVPIATSEVATATFGNTTRLSVLDFQKRNTSKILTGVTGVVDQDTGTALIEELTLKDPDPLRPQNYYVAGRVLFADGSPALRYSVELVDQDVRVQQIIGGGLIANDGFFLVQGSRQKMVQPKKPQLTLKLRVRDLTNSIVYEPSLEDILYDAKVLELSDISLTQRSPTAPTADEYTKLLGTLDSILPQAGVVATAADPLMSRIIRLREDEKYKELTYLSLTKPKVIAKPVLSQLVLSYRISAFAISQHQVDVPPSLFYALLSSDVLQSFTAETAQNIGTVDLDLSTPTDLLLYKTVRLPQEKIMATVKAAVAQSKIPKLNTDTILIALEKLRNAADGFFKVKPTPEDQMWSTIGEFLSSGQEKALDDVLKGGNAEGNLPKLLSDIIKAFMTTRAATFEVDPAVSPQNVHTPGGGELRTAPMDSIRLAQRASLGLRELARCSPQEITALLNDREDGDGPDILPPSERAQVISHELELEHPTASFAGKLSRHLESQARISASAETANETVGQDAAKIDARRLSLFLEEHPDFVLQSSNVHGFLNSIRLENTSIMTPTSESEGLEATEISVDEDDTGLSALAEDLKTVQRVFKLAPSFEKTQVLLDNGLHSSASIHAMGETEVVGRLANTDAFTVREAKILFQKASAVRLATTLLARQLQSARHALSIAALGSPLPPKTIEAVLKDFPNLRSLFELGDVCACSDCMTVYSPSAYLVDVLQFLGARKLLNSPGGPNAGLTAKDIIVRRRPDILDMDLSCDNTNVTIPFIDLVNELLEDIVAPDSGGTFSGTVVKGAISPPLLGYLRDTLKLPFTESGLVSGPDANGNFIARDKTVSVRLAPTMAVIIWKVFLLRQTYGSAATLSAEPAYLNQDAYNRLRDSTYLPNLPFDAMQQELEAYFRQSGSRRYELMEAMSKDDTTTAVLLPIAREQLSLSVAHISIITTADPFNPNKYWNANSSDPLGVLSYLHIFLPKANITYAQLQSLLNATSWLNQARSPRDMYIKHLDSSCRLDQKMIANLDLQGLDRLHRFIRLWKGLKDAVDDRWSITALDRAIGAPYIGRSKLEGAEGKDFIVRIMEISRIATAVKDSIMNVLSLFDILPIEGDIPTGLNTHRSVYLNAQKLGQVNPHFDPKQIESNRMAPPNSRRKVLAYVDYISQCLGISGTNVTSLVTDFENRTGLRDPTLDFLPLSSIYAMVTAARYLKISVDELLGFKTLTGLHPVASPRTFIEFKKIVDDVRAIGFSADDVKWVTTHRALDPSAREISDAACTKILTALQTEYKSAKAANVSPYNASATPDENRPAALRLISMLPSITAVEVAQFGNMLSGSVDVTAANTMIDEKLKDVDGIAEIKTAVANLASDPTSEEKQNAAIEAFCRVLSAHFYKQERISKAPAIIGKAFQFTEEEFGVLYRTVPRLVVLTDASVTDGELAPARLPDQYKALKYLDVLKIVLAKLKLPAKDLEWVVTSAEKLGWADLKKLPIVDGDSPLGFGPFLDLLRFYRIYAAGTFPDVINPDDPDIPLNLTGFFGLTVSDGVKLESITAYLAVLSGWEELMLTKLTENFGATGTTFRTPTFLKKLEIAVNLLRKLNLATESAIALTNHDQPTVDDIAIIRKALRPRYQDPEWLDILKSINDPLRQQRRDALVAFILATNSSLKSATDISEYLLLDVQMETETVTSRVIQAHASVQMLVQRLKMGLEPTPIVQSSSEEAAWSQWLWMSQYRLWEANRKVFLYPENWIEPELRDDKSEIFQTLEDTLKQGELTAENVEKATGAYLEALEGIADLETVAMHYDQELAVTHVFARTRGGNPATYYWRTWKREMEWTPWEKITGVEIVGKHLLPFVRENRLILAWPEFDKQNDPQQTKKAPPVPNPDSLKNPNRGEDESANRKERVIVQLAISERNPKTGIWSAKRVSTDPVFVHPSYDGYVNAVDIPESLEETITLRYMDMKNLGQVISVCRYHGQDKHGTAAAEEIIGLFNLSGCRGYPEPVRITYERAYRLAVGPYYEFLPVVKATDPSYQQSRKSRYVSAFPLAVSTILKNDIDPPVLLGKTYGRFSVTMPSQLAMVDWIIILTQLYSIARRTSSGNRLIVPYGTFAPFVYSDTRSYSMIPGFYQQDGKGSPHTMSDIYEFVNKALQLIRKHLKTYYVDPMRDVAALRKRVEVDPDYISLKKEWLDVYYRGYEAMGFQSGNMYHPLMCDLRKTFYRDGLSGLMARTTQLKKKEFDFNIVYQPAPNIRKPYPIEDLDFSLGGAYSSYNWELFFHLPFQMTQAFSNNQQFDVALQWFHKIFNPQGDDTPDPDTENPAKTPQRKYWVTKPFFKRQIGEYAEQLIQVILKQVGEHPDGLSLADVLKYSIQQWRANPYSPHTIARTRTVAYQMSVVFKYIENLLNWGDNLFRQLTRETVTQAAQLYMTADKLLGPKPQIVPPAVPTPPRTYNELASIKVDLFGNALLDLENLVPDLGTLPHDGAELPAADPLKSLYFGIPPNDKMLEYWDRVSDRLFKIRHSQNIDGVFVSLALTSPPIDPGMLVKAFASGASLGSILAGLSAPLPSYRFWFMTERATAMMGQVIQLGSSLLNMLQQRDAEGLSRLRSTLELTVLRTIAQTKEQAIKEADEQINALDKAKDITTERQTYYGGREPVNAGEAIGMSLNQISLGFDDQTRMMMITAGHIFQIPTFSVGISGFGGSPSCSVSMGGSQGGALASAHANVFASRAGSFAKMAAMATTKGSYDRRKDEWDFQKRLADKEALYIDQQKKAAQARKDILVADQKAHEAAIESSIQTDQYMRSKYTNKELYDWSISRISSVYFTAYELAYNLAKQAERCFSHELADYTSTPYIKYGYWDSLHSGLLAGELLATDIKRLESAFIDRNRREYELTKNISLQQLDPYALITLRATGTCTFSLPEAIFDLDGPGQYLRRAKAISLSIPCVTGPLTTVSVKLSQISNRYRAKSTLLDDTTASPAEPYTEDPPGADPRFMYNIGTAVQSIVTSAAVSDAGVFDLRATDARYLPFEGTGVVGTYTLELPKLRAWDYNSISDVVLHVAYTAREGGSRFRAAVEKEQVAALNDMVLDATHRGVYCAFNIRRTFSDQWWALRKVNKADIVVDVRYLPYFVMASGKEVVVKGLTWFARLAKGVQVGVEGVGLMVGTTLVTLQTTPKMEGVVVGSGGALDIGKPVAVKWKDGVKVESIVDLEMMVELKIGQ